MTLQEKMQKVEEKILQYEIDIEDKRQKIKNLKAEKKSLQSQIDKNFAEQIARQIMSHGYTEEQRQEILSKLSSWSEKTSAPSEEKIDTMSSFSLGQTQPQISKSSESSVPKSYS